MNKILISALLVFGLSNYAAAADQAISLDISDLEIVMTNAEGGQNSVTMVSLKADLTVNRNSIGLNGFMRDATGSIWATYGTCGTIDNFVTVYCGFSAENITMYFTIAAPTYSGTITAVTPSGGTYDKGTITLVAAE